MAPTLTDLIVVGAGPAGANAAITACAHGVDVHLFDEAPKAGGQVWRAPVDDLPEGNTPEAHEGSALRDCLAVSGVTVHNGQRVWSTLIKSDGEFQVDSLGPEGPMTVQAPRLVAATGAYERIVPFKGWTLPGVMGLAAATVLLKSHGVVPGERPVIAGAGPLLLAVAAGMLDAGVKPLAIIDLDSRVDWLMRLPALLTRPNLAARGAGWVARVRKAGVPILHRHAVRAVDGHDQMTRVTVSPVDASGAFIEGNDKHFDADALVVGHGLTPGGDIPRLLGARMQHDALRGGYVPQMDVFGRTSINGLFAIGDGAGIRGVDAAVTAGQACGLVVAHEADRLDTIRFEREVAPLRKACNRQNRFSDAIGGAMALRSGQVASVPKSAIVCRCEDVTRGEIEAAGDAGASDVNQLKHFTRTGMGPCQGRMCGEVAASLLAQHLGVERHAVGSFTARPPLRPVAMGELTGSFSYDDIPIPEPAPL
ncbi:MAG: NAD(P)/FAD-dependent oxidoreductase [Pseudomonadota bacterium]